LKNILHTEINTYDFHNISNTQTTRGDISVDSIRITFAYYFVSEARSVPWQDEVLAH